MSQRIFKCDVLLVLSLRLGGVISQKETVKIYIEGI